MGFLGFINFSHHLLYVTRNTCFDQQRSVLSTFNWLGRALLAAQADGFICSPLSSVKILTHHSCLHRSIAVVSTIIFIILSSSAIGISTISSYVPLYLWSWGKLFVSILRVSVQDFPAGRSLFYRCATLALGWFASFAFYQWPGLVRWSRWQHPELFTYFLGFSYFSGISKLRFQCIYWA
jgi:hypothetical protein